MRQQRGAMRAQPRDPTGAAPSPAAHPREKSEAREGIIARKSGRKELKKKKKAKAASCQPPPPAAARGGGEGAAPLAVRAAPFENPACALRPSPSPARLGSGPAAPRLRLTKNNKKKKKAFKKKIIK